uniref:Type III effector HopI1 n=1 Tax=Ganoderma boninense TaxID=34458 RepID=A0A5K1K4H4_9APHY|nr:Type III effector HopI1 [Ganoderma boninense]
MVVYAAPTFALLHIFPPLLHLRPPQPRHFVMPDENVPPQIGQKRSLDESALNLPPRKKAGVSCPWRLKGRHLGRSIHAFANYAQLVVKGIQLDKDLALLPDNEIEKFPFEVRHQYDIYQQLLQQLPDLCQGLSRESIDTRDLNKICASLQAGANASRADDVKSLKGAVIDWLTLMYGGLSPAVARNQMSGRGFAHDTIGKELCPAGLDWNDPSTKNALQKGEMIVNSDQWPIFIYLNGMYDPESPWTGLLRGRLLAFKHVFTSPSSVDDSGRSTKSSNAAMHGMTKVTPASIVYVATLVRFALGTRATFACNDTTADYQKFYNMLLAFLVHPAERENVNDLLSWWNKQVFPNHIPSSFAPTANSPLAKLMEKRNATNIPNRTALSG